MTHTKDTFQIKKTFGLGVLLKLTKNNVQGIRIKTQGDSFVSNVSVGTLSRAVDTTLKKHNIELKIS
ncbi:MAG TPA: hypothetical protein DHV36_05830 [Desulfobacteraceae bacterium]|nr:hypothetical protein [Desulfobacteraceae bacterium]|tara:strand:- start:1555 stop:1755 length:201 start_codon:yes stop_codon:yes gene_type:complete